MTAPDWIILSLVSALTGITASMGLGGGFILVIYLTVFKKMAQLEAQGINLLFFLGVFFARAIGSDLLRKIFAGFVLLVGVREIFSAFRKKNKAPEKDGDSKVPDHRQNTDR